MATQFAPVELGTIKQGEFVDECEKAFRRIQKGLIVHTEEFKRSATAVLTSKITIKYDAEKEAFAIVTDIDEKLPKKPSKVTTAFVSEDPASGEVCLFSQAAGTTKGNPRQSLLCTEKGESLSPVTGKPIANSKPVPKV